ncbi:MAG: glycosyltransferase family 2 protein [Planctomyces sp.]|nr:glycosyltransferase family 2 protein [Planctomyces sp.]
MSVNAHPISTDCVAIVIPCFNQGHFAAEAVDSALAQTWPETRIILIDDASTDGVSPGLCRELASDQVRVVCLEENQGRASIRNRCLEQAGDAEFLLMLDCDDALTPDYVTQLVTALQAQPRAGFAYGTWHYFGTRNGQPAAGTWPREEWSRDRMYLEEFVSGSGMLFRTQALRDVGGWKPEHNPCGAEDRDIALTILEAGWDLVRVHDAAMRYRQHDSSSLAVKTRSKRRMVECLILKNHRAGIRGNCGVRAFVKRRLFTGLIEALHHRRRDDLRDFAPLLRLCPITTASLVLEYYASAVLRRFRRPSSTRREQHSGPAAERSPASQETAGSASH